MKQRERNKIKQKEIKKAIKILAKVIFKQNKSIDILYLIGTSNKAKTFAICPGTLIKREDALK